MNAQLKSTTEGQTMVLTLSNPAQGNALGPGMYAAGIEALNATGSAAEIRSVIIVGEGACFCAGGSVQTQTQRPGAAQMHTDSIDALHHWIEAIHAFPKPVIAAVEGMSAGAGFALALACDFIVAARDAVFAASGSHVALSPDGGLSWQLAQALPRQLASEWLMLGESVAAERLHAFGLVNRLCDNGQALASALALAQQLNARAPNMLASTKELLSEAQSTTLSTHLDSERDAFVRNLHHPNASIALAALSEQKMPRYF